MKKHIAIIAAFFLFCAIIMSGCNEQQAPVISLFEFVPNEIEFGESCELRWVVSGATSVTIDNGIGTVNLSGNRTIQPMETTTYTLSAKSTTTNVTASAQINVIPLENPNISMIQYDAHIEIVDMNKVRLNQSRVLVIVLNNTTGEDQTSILRPAIIDGDGDPKTLGIGDVIIFDNLTDFPVAELWDVQLYYNNQLIGQCIFKNPRNPYDIPRVLMVQSGFSVIILGIIYGPIEQTSCSIIAINKTSGEVQTSALGAVIFDNDNNPTLLSVGDQIIFSGLSKFQKGDQWTIQLAYKGIIIGHCLFTNQQEIIIIPP